MINKFIAGGIHQDGALPCKKCSEWSHLRYRSDLPQLTLPQLASAQSSSPGETWSTKQAQVKNKLEQAGYKDVRIIPLSYLVQATDKDGNPVMMVLNPIL